MKRVLLMVVLVALTCGAIVPLAGGPPPLSNTDLLVSGIFSPIKRYDATTGAFEGNTSCGGSPVGDMAIGPDGKLYVGQGNLARIVRCDPLTGQTLNVFATMGPMHLYRPEGFTFGPDGNLYVAVPGGFDGTNTVQGRVMRFNGTTGAFIDNFISSHVQFPGFNFAVAPRDLVFRPDGSLFVRYMHGVARHDPQTGAFLGILMGGFPLQRRTARTRSSVA